jgi:hypothetical protein
MSVVRKTQLEIPIPSRVRDTRSGASPKRTECERSTLWTEGDDEPRTDSQEPLGAGPAIGPCDALRRAGIQCARDGDSA